MPLIWLFSFSSKFHPDSLFFFSLFFFFGRNGGMCMHDEATAHYIDMIDQTTLGHRFIKEEFNVTPRIGWQIDPFGHSAVQAYLLGAEVWLTLLICISLSSTILFCGGGAQLKFLTLLHSFATALLCASPFVDVGWI
jgi:hypothetical protein